MPTIDCDPAVARDRLEAAGVETAAASGEHERWRAERGDAVVVAYDDTVVVQGSRPADVLGLLRDETGRAHVYFDGASHGNPGPAAVGWAIVTDDGVVDEGGERIGEATNNRAEYEALVRALTVARDHGFDEVDVRGDSQLVVKQVRGEWDANDPDLRERRVRARELLRGFGRWSLQHVPREVNERADACATEALEGA